MEFHPAAGIFPLMRDEKLEVLADDIAANGLPDPIGLLDGKVLDGRNRWRACLIAAVEPRFEDLPPDTNPVAYVISKNATRRHLTAKEKAFAAARAWPHFAASLGGDRRSDQASETRTVGRTDERLAEMFDVSKDYVNMARALMKEAPSVAAAVEAGTVKLPTAYWGLKRRQRHQMPNRLNRRVDGREVRMASVGATRLGYIEEALLEAEELIGEGWTPDERRQLAHDCLPQVQRLLGAVKFWAEGRDQMPGTSTVDASNQP